MGNSLVGVRGLGWGSSSTGSRVEFDSSIVDGVGVGGGAGSAQSSFGVKEEEDGDRAIVEGVSDGAGAASAQSSLEVLVPVVVAGVLRPVTVMVGVIALGVVAALDTVRVRVSIVTGDGLGLDGEVVVAAFVVG